MWPVRQERDFSFNNLMKLNLNSYMQVVVTGWAMRLQIVKVNVSKEMTSCLMLLEGEVQGSLRQDRG